MDVACDGKWFWIEPVDAPVAEAALRILALRTADVQKYLPLAARHDADDVEYVHQLRVSCRRSAAAVRAFKPLVGRRVRKLDRWLSRLRRAAGPARDADVLAARLREELGAEDPHVRQVLAIVDQARLEAQADLARIDARAARGGLKRAIDRAVQALGRAKPTIRKIDFASYARESLRTAAAPLGDFHVQSAGLADLHQLRIAAKRLRYSIEIFHAAAAPGIRTRVYPVVEEMQDRLGALNDRGASQLRFQRWLAELPADDFAAFTASLVVAEHAGAARLCNEFLAWWTPERECEFQSLLSQAVASD